MKLGKLGFFDILEEKNAFGALFIGVADDGSIREYRLTSVKVIQGYLTNMEDLRIG